MTIVLTPSAVAKRSSAAASRDPSGRPKRRSPSLCSTSWVIGPEASDPVYTRAAIGEGWVNVPLTIARPAWSGVSAVAWVCGRYHSVPATSGAPERTKRTRPAGPVLSASQSAGSRSSRSTSARVGHAPGSGQRARARGVGSERAARASEATTPAAGAPATHALKCPSPSSRTLPIARPAARMVPMTRLSTRRLAGRRLDRSRTITRNMTGRKAVSSTARRSRRRSGAATARTSSTPGSGPVPRRRRRISPAGSPQASARDSVR